MKLVSRIYSIRPNTHRCRCRRIPLLVLVDFQSTNYSWHWQSHRMFARCYCLRVDRFGLVVDRTVVSVFGTRVSKCDMVISYQWYDMTWYIISVIWYIRDTTIFQSWYLHNQNFNSISKTWYEISIIGDHWRLKDIILMCCFCPPYHSLIRVCITDFADFGPWYEDVRNTKKDNAPHPWWQDFMVCSVSQRITPYVVFPWRYHSWKLTILLIYWCASHALIYHITHHITHITYQSREKVSRRTMTMAPKVNFGAK